MFDKPVLPDWMKTISNDSLIGVAEICQIFGAHRFSVPRCVENGSIPAPTVVLKRDHGPSANKWRMGDIRKYLRSNGQIKAGA